jgi:capsular exopolysaccharide synthesis family protein
VLVDLDLRNPSAHKLVDTHNEFGMSDVLTGRRPLRECLQHLEVQEVEGTGRSSMYFIGTGPPVHNPTELLGSSRTARTLDGLGKQADVVLVDTPPVLPVADALVIGRLSSGAVLVVEASRTAFQAVQQSKDLLIRNQTRLMGIVMNKFPARDAEYNYGYYGYGYEPSPSQHPRNLGSRTDWSNGSSSGDDKAADPTTAH